MRSILFAVAVMLVLLPELARGDGDDPIRRLDWLIGEWAFDDIAIDGHYRETGTRNCEYALNDTYILCQSVGTSNKGKIRSYHFYFKYNREDERFEMIALTGYYPRTDLYVLELSEDNRTIEIKTGTWTKDGLKPQSEATIIYDGTDQYVWNIRHGEIDEATGRPKVSFRDTVTRK